MKLLTFGFLCSTFFLTGCFFGYEECGENYYRGCQETGSITDCRTYGSSTTCTTREGCVSYGCVYAGPTFRTGILGQLQNPALRTQQLTIKDLAVDKVMAAAANADLQYMDRLGLNVRDLQAIAQSDSLSPQALQRVAQTLKESPELIKEVATDISQAFQAQRADLKSVYWQTCMALGEWKTDKNPLCRSTRWFGCSPEEGATLCVSDVGANRLKLNR